MSDGYSYNPAGGLDTSADLIAVTKKLEQSLDALERAAEAFKQANHGEAPANYSLAQAQWNQGQIKMNMAMGKGIKALDEIHAAILHGDRVGANQFL
ncbi:hypothetical protein [Kineosporia sp. NBRC 101731]|uniref:WXG100 family type VII secretion target n=1 Tax=Kineosporia sp. NBRC 101731 TaxID=3032199 RepID=UPI0024A0BFE6|nr:hypothetical protein [Kineosporia sp. NBRC 101731]GLY33786.1 hypothetical protein Kisp02_71510 [Kineosporia sp. NBRC 101731]